MKYSNCMSITIPLIGEFDPNFVPHIATASAIKHSAAQLGVEVEAPWTSTEDLTDDLVAGSAGIWILPGSPYKNLQKTLNAIRFARESGIPCFGTCGGFQHMILEYARNVLGYRDAGHAEYDPYASSLFISTLACSLAGRTMTLQFTPGSRIASIYGRLVAEELYYCNFGVNPKYVDVLASSELRITGRDTEGEVRVMEVPEHPFFIGTLFVPQTLSRTGAPHPLVTAFVSAAAVHLAKSP